MIFFEDTRSLTALLAGSRLYGIEFDNGTVKIGRTTDVARRVGQHADSAAAFAINIIRGWVSELVDHPIAAEGDLIRGLSREAQTLRNEYFVGVTLDRTADVAQAAIEAQEAKFPSTVRIGSHRADMLTSAKVRAAIDASGFTVRELATLSGISVPSIYRKIGGHRVFTIGEVALLADALNLDPRSLIEFGEVSA